MEENKGKIKKDCFGYKEKGGIPGCTALKELYCRKEECVFYKQTKTGKSKHISRQRLVGQDALKEGESQWAM